MLELKFLPQVSTSAIEQLGNALRKGEAVVLAGSILAIAAMTILNVGCRWLLGFSLAITEEVSEFCVIISCFVGLSYASSLGRHIRMTAIYGVLPHHLRKILMVIITSSTAALMFALAWFAACYVLTVYKLGGSYPASRVPFYAVYLVAPLGFFLTGIQYALSAIRNLTEPDVYISFERVDVHEEAVVQEI